MAVSITFTMNDNAQAQLLLDSFCISHNYIEEVPNPDYDDQLPVDPETNPVTIPNPETKAQFIKRITMAWWKSEAMRGKIKLDYQTRQTEMEAVDIA